MATRQTSNPPRYAIFFTPREGSALARFEGFWFGTPQRVFRPGTAAPHAPAGAAFGNSAVIPARSSLSRQVEITAEPAIYGLHATLKAPFVLAAGRNRSHLLRLARTFAQGRRPVRLPRLRLDELDGFLALRTASECPEASALAASCTQFFDAVRAPPSAEELARRRARDLTGRQEALLSRWGYPYVLDAWRFHMTLTVRLDGSRRRAVANQLAPLLRSAIRHTLVIDAITVSVQEHPHEPFRAAGRFPLRPS